MAGTAMLYQNHLHICARGCLSCHIGANAIDSMFLSKVMFLVGYRFVLSKAQTLLANFFAHAKEANHATIIIPSSIGRQQMRIMRTTDAVD